MPFVVVPLEPLHKRINEQPYFHRKVRAGLKRDVHGEPRKVPVVEHRDKATGLDVVVDDVFGLYEDAHVVERGDAQYLAVIRLDQWLYFENNVFAPSCERKLAWIVGKLIVQQAVLHKLRWESGAAVRLDVAWRSSQNPARRRQSSN